MKVRKNEQFEHFEGEDGELLRVRYDNRGEPYREGVTFMLEERRVDNYEYVSMFLEGREVTRLRDLLIKLYPLE